MNIAQLLHNCTEQQLISHWPVYTMGEHKKIWYFYSVKGITLRKKIQNTSIVGFLQACHRDDGQDSASMMVLEVQQVDCRQPRQGQLYQIKVTKRSLQQILQQTPKTDEHIIKANNWSINPYNQISLYKITNPQLNKIYSLHWLQNIITCKAPINTYHREKLSQYAELLCKKVGEKLLANLLYVKQFQLVFTYDQRNGRLRVLFAHNFVLGCGRVGEDEQEREFAKIREMYRSDLKIGRDEHECMQIFIQELKDKSLNKPLPVKEINKQNNATGKDNIIQQTKIEQPNLFSQQDQQKRLQYLKLLQKLHSETALAANIKINLKKQQLPKSPPEQFQCSCCYSCVVVGQFQHKHMISSNRIPQIQFVRQVKMKANMNSVGDYQLVPVCSLCYDKFKQIVNQRANRRPSKSKQQKSMRVIDDEKQISIKNRVNSVKPKSLLRQLDLVKEEEKNKLSITSTNKQIRKIPYFKTNFVKCDEQYTTKTNTTTIRQELNISKQKGKMEFYVSEKPEKPRKSSLCLQNKDKTNPTTITQIPVSQNTLNPQQQKHKSVHTGKRQTNRIFKQEKCPSIDFETDDQLSHAVAEYEDMGISNKNKEKIRNMRNIGQWRKRVF